MLLSEFNKLPNGAFIFEWFSGGQSAALIWIMHDGSRNYMCSNWTSSWEQGNGAPVSKGQAEAFIQDLRCVYPLDDESGDRKAIGLCPSFTYKGIEISAFQHNVTSTTYVTTDALLSLLDTFKACSVSSFTTVTNETVTFKTTGWQWKLFQLHVEKSIKLDTEEL